MITGISHIVGIKINIYEYYYKLLEYYLESIKLIKQKFYTGIDNIIIGYLPISEIEKIYIEIKDCFHQKYNIQEIMSLLKQKSALLDILDKTHQNYDEDDDDVIILLNYILEDAPEVITNIWIDDRKYQIKSVPIPHDITGGCCLVLGVVTGSMYFGDAQQFKREVFATDNLVNISNTISLQKDVTVALSNLGFGEQQVQLYIIPKGCDCC